MKRNRIALLLSVLLLFALSACGSQPAQTDSGNWTVAATTYPVYLFTRAVTDGVEGVDTELIVQQQTSCLHDYTLTVRDMRIIEGADVLVLNGAGLEDFMDDALAAASASVIDASEGVALLPYTGHADHDHGADEAEGDHYDPHIWMDPERAAQMVQTIGEGLAQADPDHAETYRNNAQSASLQLEELAQTLRDSVEVGQLACRELITFHDGFQYFSAAFGFMLLKSIEEEEGSEASARDLAEIVSLVEEYQLPAIFTEVNGSDASAQAIARETGVQVCTLDMIMSGDGDSLDSYCEAMTENVSTIVKALQEGQVTGA